MAKQRGTVHMDFGGYELSSPTSGAIERFAADVVLTVETLLLLAGGANLDSGVVEDGYKAAGELLGWARKCQAYHGAIDLTGPVMEKEPAEQETRGKGKAA